MSTKRALESISDGHVEPEPVAKKPPHPKTVAARLRHAKETPVERAARLAKHNETQHKRKADETPQEADTRKAVATTRLKERTDEWWYAEKARIENEKRV